MRVLVSTTAGTGHFGPLVPFAAALRRAGHQVVVASPASFAGGVLAAGFEHEPFGEPRPEELGAVFGRLPALSMAEANRIVLVEVFGTLDARAAYPGLGEIFDRLRPDLVVREPAEVASLVHAEARGIAHLSVNIGLDSMIDHLLPVAAALADLGLADPEQCLRQEPRWTLLPESIDVSPKATVGSRPLRFRETPDTTAGAPLPGWGSPEDPLVYISFGTVAAGLGLFPALYRGVLDAVSELPVRVMLTTGRGVEGDKLGPLPPNAHVEAWWPQADVLTLASVVVHHGGFGTLLGALTAGRPQVILPLFSVDQFDNAARVHAAKVGVSVPADLSSAGDGPSMTFPSPALMAMLGITVQAVLTDPGYLQRAGQYADEVAALPTTADCVAATDHLVNS